MYEAFLEEPTGCGDVEIPHVIEDEVVIVPANQHENVTRDYETMVNTWARVIRRYEWDLRNRKKGQ